MSTDAQLLTAEDFFQLPDLGRPLELVRGRTRILNPPGLRHGHVCLELAYQLRRYLETHSFGRAVSNDAGVVTQRDPDTVRGADVAYFSFHRLPASEPMPVGYHRFVPDLVFEVLSPSDARRDMAVKVDEYLNAGVVYVTVIDPGARSAFVYRADHPPIELGVDDLLSYPDILPGFKLRVGLIC